MIETIISLFLLTVGVIGTFVVLQKIIASGSLISSRLTAAYLAQEGIEIVRNFRDNYWLHDTEYWDDFFNDTSICSSGCEIDYDDTNFSSYSGEYLQIDNSGFYNYDFGNPTKFQRKITIEGNLLGVGSDAVKVLVEVNWEEKSQSYKILVQENLYNWWRE